MRDILSRPIEGQGNIRERKLFFLREDPTKKWLRDFWDILPSPTPIYLTSAVTPNIYVAHIFPNQRVKIHRQGVEEDKRWWIITPEDDKKVPTQHRSIILTNGKKGMQAHIVNSEVIAYERYHLPSILRYKEHTLSPEEEYTLVSTFTTAFQKRQESGSWSSHDNNIMNVEFPHMLFRLHGAPQPSSHIPNYLQQIQQEVAQLDKKLEPPSTPKVAPDNKRNWRYWKWAVGEQRKHILGDRIDLDIPPGQVQLLRFSPDKAVRFTFPGGENKKPCIVTINAKGDLTQVGTLFDNIPHKNTEWKNPDGMVHNLYRSIQHHMQGFSPQDPFYQRQLRISEAIMIYQKARVKHDQQQIAQPNPTPPLHGLRLKLGIHKSPLFPTFSFHNEDITPLSTKITVSEKPQEEYQTLPPLEVLEQAHLSDIVPILPGYTLDRDTITRPGIRALFHKTNIQSTIDTTLGKIGYIFRDDKGKVVATVETQGYYMKIEFPLKQGALAYEVTRLGAYEAHYREYAPRFFKKGRFPVDHDARDIYPHLMELASMLRIPERQRTKPSKLGQQGILEGFRSFQVQHLSHYVFPQLYKFSKQVQPEAVTHLPSGLTQQRFIMPTPEETSLFALYKDKGQITSLLTGFGKFIFHKNTVILEINGIQINLQHPSLKKNIYTIVKNLDTSFIIPSQPQIRRQPASI